MWLPLLTRTHQRMRDYKECLQQNLPTNIFPVWLSVEFRNTNHINSFYGKIPMQEKSFTSLWLGSIMVLMQRTLDWGNSLKISLSSLCIEVKRVRKKSRPRNRQDDVFEQFHAAFHAYNTNETKTFRFDSLWAPLGSQHSECQRLCHGKTKPGPVHDVPVQKSLIYRLYRHIRKV